MKRAVFFTLGVLLALGLNGCELPREGRPSVLVVAVEGLGFDELSCDSDEGEGGPGTEAFRTLCQESVRFSHAFTPSTMSQATMASLMTGLYPFDHGVRHNGADFLSARARTLAEGALGRGYRTLFVSGGPPIWRKSGLAQGFEIFEDNVNIEPGFYYRPAKEVFRIATQWMDTEAAGRPVFSVMYLADLQFPQIATQDNEGLTRERSFDGQIEEVNESLGNLFAWLRRNKRWNSTHILLVGLNSTRRRENETDSPLSLKSESVQVTLMIKPARKERDNIIQWGVDRNVSLVDVGYTLFQVLGLEAPVSSLSLLKPESLLSSLSQPEPDWSEDRLILTETAWPDWMEGAGVRWAVRQNNFVYIHDEKPLIYNTLTDRMENFPLKVNDPLWTSLNSGIMQLLAKAQTPPFRGMQPHWMDQIHVARSLWAGDQPIGEVRGDETWAKWAIERSIESNQWREVKKISQQIGDPIGTFVAAKHLGENLPVPRNSCVRLLLSPKGDRKVFQSECEDERILSLHAWLSARNEEEKSQAQERFIRLYSQEWLDQEIGRANYVNDLRWDVDRGLPTAPPAVEYLLTLKEFEPFARRLSSVLAGKDFRL